jgi:chromosome segregation ATPase
MPSAGPQATQREIERWRQRERRLIEALQSVEDERHRLDDELLKVEQQVAYYDSLTREMKRELGRPGLSSLLSSLRRA